MPQVSPQCWILSFLFIIMFFLLSMGALYWSVTYKYNMSLMSNVSINKNLLYW